MNLAAISIDPASSAGKFIVFSYMIGGLLLFVTAFLPNTSTGWRIFNAIAGIGIAGWAGAFYLDMVNSMPLSYYVALLPYILVVRGIAAMDKRRKAAPQQAQYGYGPQ